MQSFVDGRFAQVGWQIPNIDISYNGRPDRLWNQVSPGDLVFCFSPHCIHCADAVPELLAVRQRSLSRNAGRLVALAVKASPAEARQFCEFYGLECDALLHVDLQWEVTKIGALALPWCLLLGPSRVVARTSRMEATPPLAVSIPNAFGDREAAKLVLGLMSLQSDPKTIVRGPNLLRITTDSVGVEVSVYLIATPASYAGTMELVVCLQEGVITELAPLVWAQGASSLLPPDPVLQEIKGKTLRDALQACDKYVGERGPTVVWRSLEWILKTLHKQESLH